LFAVPVVNVARVDDIAFDRVPDDGVFAVTRTGGDLSRPLTVSVGMFGSATNGVDYEQIGNSVTIPAGASFTHVPLRVRPDVLVEGTESALLVVLPSAGYLVGNPDRSSVLIRDDGNTIFDDTEPNESPGDYHPLGEVTDAGTRLTSMSINAPTDVDYYRFTARAGAAPMAVMIEFDHALGDLNLAVFDEFGRRELARSAGTGDVERVTLPAEPGQSFIVRVSGNAGATNPLYAIDVRPVRSGPSLHVAHTVYDFDYNTHLFPPAPPGKAARVTETLTNIGDAPLELGEMALPAGMQIAEPAKARLEPGESDAVTFVSTGTTPGSRTADVTFNTNEAGGGARSIHFLVPVTGVAARTFLYNNSAADGRTPRIEARDRAAADPAKRALLPGEAVTSDNVSNYSKGVNGVLLSLVRPGRTALTPEDFVVRFGGADGQTWAAGPDSLNVLATVDSTLTTNVELVWPDYVPDDSVHTGQAVANGWLEVTVKRNERTGLEAPETFYFGNLVGDTGNNPARPTVNALDLAAVRSRLNTTPGDWRYDMNRDGTVNGLDLAIVRANLGRRLGPPPASAPQSLFSTTPVATSVHDLVAALLE
jgi:hypothetical protein